MRPPRTRHINVRSLVHALAGREPAYPVYRFSRRAFLERPGVSPFGELQNPLDPSEVGPLVTSTAPPAGQALRPYPGHTFTASGHAPLTWSVVEGVLPSGLRLDPGTGALSGTPSVASTAVFTVQVRDRFGAFERVQNVLTIAPRESAVALVTAVLPDGMVGVRGGDVDLQATGGLPPYAFALRTGRLPVGITLSATGRIAGTPTEHGTFSVVVRVTDTRGDFQDAALSLTIARPAPPVITSGAPPIGRVGTRYPGLTLTGTGTPPLTWRLTMGQVPPGLVWNPDAGTLTGTPTEAGTVEWVIDLFDTFAQSDRARLTVTVLPSLPPVITSGRPPATLNGGVPYVGHTFTATTDHPPITWTLVGGFLPDGMTLSRAGRLAGTPSNVGDFPLRVRATDALGASTDERFTLRVLAVPVPVITSGPPPASVEQRTRYPGHTFTASSGVEPITWSISSGGLPPGLTLSATGQLTGTPTVAGDYSATARATDRLGGVADQAFTIEVTAPPPPVITSGAPPSPAGQDERYPGHAFTATSANPPVRWSIASGALPPGLALSATGQLTGTPTTAGTFTARLAAVDAVGGETFVNVTLVITPPPLAPPTLTSGTPPTPVERLQPYPGHTFTAASTNGAVRWSLASGALPTGLRLSLTGQLTGTPTRTGDFAFVVRATDAAGLTADRALNIRVTPSPPPVITSGSLATARQHTPYAGHTFTATTDHGPLTWTRAAGSLPEGITLTGDGRLIGTPTADGTFRVRVRVTDSAGESAEQAVTLTVAPSRPPSVTTTQLPSGTEGASYATQAFATTPDGLTPLTWSLASGPLPAGLTLTSGGAIQGTPAPGTATLSPYAIRLQVTDRVGQTGTSATLSLVIREPTPPPPPVITSGAPASPTTQHARYVGHTFTATSTNGAVSWAVTAGAWPAGLTLNAVSGALDGVPTQTGTFTVTVTATNTGGGRASVSVTLVVTPSLPPVVTGDAALPLATEEVRYSATLTAVSPGALTPLAWSLRNGSLPAGLTLSTAGALTGIPGADTADDSPYTLALRVTDRVGRFADVTRTLTIAPAAPPPSSGPPIIRSLEWTFLANQATTFNVGMPLDVEAGDALIAFVGVDFDNTITAPPEFTERVQSRDDDDNASVQIAQRVATGTEGGQTFPWSVPRNEQWSAIVIAVRDWDGDLDTLVIPAFSTPSGGTIDIDPPPAVAPTPGEYLAIAVGFTAQGTMAAPTAYPYPDERIHVDTGSSSGVGLSLCSDEITTTAADETIDPGPFTYARTARRVGITVLVPPARRVTPPPAPQPFATQIRALEGGRGPRIWYRMAGPGPGIPNEGHLGATHNLTEQVDFARWNGRYRQPGVPILSAPSEGQGGAVSGAADGNTTGRLANSAAVRWTSGGAGTWIVVLSMAGSADRQWIGGQGRLGNTQAILLRRAPANQFLLHLQTARGVTFTRTVALPTPNPFDDGGFHAIAIRKNNDTFAPDIFVDGVRVPASNLTDQNRGAPPGYWFDDLTPQQSSVFARVGIASRRFSGSIDEWIVTDDVLTDETLAAITTAALANAPSTP